MENKKTIEWKDEQVAIFDTKGSVLVSASAGSGKTTVLIEKIIRLLQEGKDLRRILVMTFSRTSAQDMKNKLVEELYKKMSIGSGSDKLLRKQLDNIPFANISTINSFCYTLMKRYFSVIGVDPSCSIMDEKEQKLLLEACLDKTLEKRLENPDPAFMRTVEFFSQKQSLDGFKSALMKMRDFLTCQEDPEKYLRASCEDTFRLAEGYYLRYISAFVRKFLRQGQELLAAKKAESYARDDEYHRDAVLRAQRALQGDLNVLFSELIGMETPARGMYGSDATKKGIISIGLAEECAAFNKEIKALSGEAQKIKAIYDAGDPSEEIRRVLIEVYRENEKEYAARKKQRSVVDFNDAERAALAVLKNAAVREEVKNSYDYIFIDEYQDTNYLQEAILLDISREDNLFAVGDVKQAIFHFRYAEPEIFSNRKKLYDSMPMRGTSRLLNINFRSCKKILNFTNEVCAEVMTDLFGGVDYKREAMLRGEKEEGADDAVRVLLYHNDEEKKQPPAPGEVYRVKTGEKVNVEDREAAFIAEEIERQVKEGGKYEDFAVLFRKAKNIKNVVAELEKKKIPYYVLSEKKSVLPERETLIDVLRLLINDIDDISMINVLTNGFGFSPAELMEIRSFSPKSTFSEAVLCYDGKPEVREKTEAFKQKIEKWRFAAGYMTVAELMREILKDGFDAVFMERGRIAQINSFVLYVEQQSARMSLEQFVYYYDNVYDGNASPAPPSAVRLMTQHSSKGLQFPVVFLPYASQSFSGNKQNSSGIECDKDLGIAVRRYEESEQKSAPSFGYYVMSVKKKLEDKESDLRLAYVAFTRAQNKLIITGKEKSFGKNAEDADCVMDWLLFAKQRNGGMEKYFGEIPAPTISVSAERTFTPKTLDLKRLEWKYDFERETKMYAKTSVSGILDGAENRGVKKLVREEAGQKAEVGTAMHAVLQYIDYSVDTADKVRFEVDRMVREGILRASDAELVDCGKIAAVLNAPEMAPLRKYPSHREYAFISYCLPPEGGADKVLVQGVIDLLIDLPDGTCMLVDYKMSSLEPQKLIERYTEQLKWYKNAVESILKKTVSVSILYNLNRGECVKIEG